METKSQQVKQRIMDFAAAKKYSILLPEAGSDNRTLHAALKVAQLGFAKPILVGAKGAVSELAGKEGLDISGLELIDPEADQSALKECAAAYKQKRAKENLTDEQSVKQVSDPLYYAAMLVGAGKADGMVAGAVTTTGDVLRASIKCIGLQPGSKTVSSHFIMIVPDSPFGDEGVLLFADSAVVVDPTAEQVADIAIATADLGKALVGLEPKIAMLSFSTKGSASSPSVTKMREAAEIVKKVRPDLPVDGELQLDAAIVESVGKKKAPGSDIAGKANVLVFPNLDAGNIGYKLVQRLANADAIGPILQGLAKSVNDLSRGCSVQDIVDVTAITAAKAAMLADSKPEVAVR